MTMTGNKPEEEKENEEKAVEKVEHPEFVMKHPLQNSWSLWYFEPDKRRSWSENLKEITTFESVEDFWSIYNHIKPASEIKQGCDYSLFKKGIQPMWEDAGNKLGGRWLISLEKKQRGNELDNYWLEILLLMIGEDFDDSAEEICGATVNIRNKMDKIGLWTANADRAAKVIAIGRKVKERLKIDPKMTIPFQRHTDTSVKNSNAIKSTYTV